MNYFKMVCWGYGLLLMSSAQAHGPQPMPLQRVPIPPVPGLVDGADPIVVNKDVAVALGKALFWDVNVGSDGQACASCHFHAGADTRVTNQLNPGQRSGNATGQTFQSMYSNSGGPNYTLTSSDFPLQRYSNPLNKTSGVTFSTDDVVGSAGTFGGAFSGVSKFTGANDQCGRSANATFNVNHVGVRGVTPRNAPTVINAVFNYRQFWDGRANNVFNGSSIWGDRDPNAGVWVKTSALSAQKQRLELINSALASQALGPPLDHTEMSCAQRKWPDIGRKLLLRQPLQNQKVHYQDSVLGAYSLSSIGNLQPGLNTTYQALIKKAFNQKYWSVLGTAQGQFGSPIGGPAYQQIEANFSMFFGLAVQLYESTLVSDQAPIDLTARDASNNPTWTNLGYTQAQITSLNNGRLAFENNHCQICHGGPVATIAAIVPNATLVSTTAGMTYGPSFYPIPYGPQALGLSNGAAAAGITLHGNVITRDLTTDGNGNQYAKLMDFGFVNTGVADPNADPGVDNVDDFGNPLSFTKQYIQYLLNNPAGIVDGIVKSQWSCDFLQPLANNDLVSGTWFGILDGLIADGSKENLSRNTDCLLGTSAFLPTASAAQANLSGVKMQYATKAAFKVPTLRNVELTGPYMHNGSMATLQQVVEFYARLNNFDNADKHTVTTQINLSSANSAIAKQRTDLIAFLKSYTDDRVRYQQAPFDHPEIQVLHGHSGNNLSVTPGNALTADLGQDVLMTIPAVGATGSADPLLSFDSGLAP